MNAARILLLAMILVHILGAFGAQQPTEQDGEKLRQQRMKRQEQELRRQETSYGGRAIMRANLTANVRATDLTGFAPFVRTEGCLAQAMVPDTAVDWQGMPLAEWIAAGDKEQIPWRVEAGKPELRFDQRYEVGYWGSIEVKDLEWPEDGEELHYVTGISSSDGEWIIPPKIGQRVFENRSAAEPRILFGDCVFLRPGDYNLVIAVFDTHSGKRSLTQRRLRTTDFSEEPLPALARNLPVASFPESDDSYIDNPEIRPATLLLPVSNKRPLDIELISPLNFPNEWAGRPDFIRAATNRLLAAMSVLSQLKLETASISATAVDLVNRATLFEQQNLLELDWKRLADAYPKLADTSRLSLTAIETRKDRATFFRQFVEKRVQGSKERPRVLIIVSGSMLFEGGSDLTPVAVTGDCQCRVYYLHFQVTTTDGFDDLDKILRRLRPKTFGIASAHDFRKAVAEIVRDLESF